VARFGDVQVAMWSDPDVEDLSADAMLLYLWSFTNPRANMAGLYKVSRRSMCECKLTEKRLTDALAELTAGRFLFYVDNVLWVRTRVKHLRTRTVQIAKGIITDLRVVPDEHELRVAFVAEYRDTTFHELADRLADEPQVNVTRGSGEPHLNGSTEPNGVNLTRPSPEGQGQGQGLRQGPTTRTPLSVVAGASGTEPPKIKHGGRVVPAERQALAESILADFNEQASTGYAPLKASGAPSDNLSRVLTALAEHPEITAEIAHRMVTAQLAQPYWLPARPHLGNVFGPGVVERNLEQARNPAPAAAGPSIDKYNSTTKRAS
jgi:hypothetical protein